MSCTRHLLFNFRLRGALRISVS